MRQHLKIRQHLALDGLLIVGKECQQYTDREFEKMASIQKTEIKIEKLCRTCLSKDNELCSLFDVIIGVITLDFIVTSITGLKVMLFVFDNIVFAE